MTAEILCKLTTQNLTTFDGFQWTPGEWVETSGQGDLCSSGWIHAYTHPLLASLLNPIHADIRNPILFAIEAEGARKNDHGLKVGFTRMRLMQELDLPVLTPEQRIAFGIYCALEVYSEPSFVAWAQCWLGGSDRSPETAWAPSAAAAARAAAELSKTLDLISIAKRAVEYDR